jgi:phosphoribosylaminoimidazole-succinocarboxamide synthase
MHALKSSKELGLTPARSGKVRDIFCVDDCIVIVATDRISAFDVVMNEPIPEKGVVLTALTKFWTRRLADIIPNHVIRFGTAGLPDEFTRHADVLDRRTMVCRRARVLPVECIVRGYLSGSGWKEYRTSGTVCGIRLPGGLRESDRLPEPLFTPSTKADVGHDENITYEQAAALIGEDMARAVRDASLALYNAARDYAETRGIIIADTKFEFGIDENTGSLMVIDELLTPDSSRFWPAAQYEPGHGQPSFDKQFVRDYLETLDWNKQPPPPPLPQDVVETTAAKYREIVSLLDA